jgi:hypothetical protein
VDIVSLEPTTCCHSTDIAKVRKRVARHTGSVRSSSYTTSIERVRRFATMPVSAGLARACRHSHEDVAFHSRSAISKELEVQTVHVGRDASIAKGVVIEIVGRLADSGESTSKLDGRM